MAAARSCYPDTMSSTLLWGAALVGGALLWATSTARPTWKPITFRHRGWLVKITPQANGRWLVFAEEPEIAPGFEAPRSIGFFEASRAEAEAKVRPMIDERIETGS